MIRIYLLIFVYAITMIDFIKGQSIHWQHFDKNTIEKAKKENKPILLHLAANWCHWCHVMEEKTYTDKLIVDYVNKHFIACKEDHDLRPDLANKYRDYGWPATIIFSSKGVEIFKNAGYIEAKEFLSILKAALKGQLSVVNSSSKFNLSNLALNIHNLSFIQKDVFNSLDLNKGGFQSAQKSIDWDMFEYAMLHQYNDTLKKWLDITLDNSFGLMDTVWGGIYQYSTYGDWDHPHYEKLLSVQARYIQIYLNYYYFNHQKKYLDAALNIYRYCKRFLYSKQHKAFYNAQDADLIKGVKATDYFASSDNERLKQGIPAIDTSINTENNARMCQSLLSLFAYTQDSIYFFEARDVLNFILTHRKKSNYFLHASDTLSPPALIDQIILAKAVLKFYNLTNQKDYLDIFNQTMQNIYQSFFNQYACYSYKPVQNYLHPDFIVSENIEAARLFNMAYYVLHQEVYKQAAQFTLGYLTSDEVYDKIITEPGILTLYEECNHEPYTASVLNFSNDILSFYNLLLNVARLPYFNYYIQILTPKNIPDDKRNLTDSFIESNQNLILICTSKFCSAPIYTTEELQQFILKQIFKL